MVVIQGNVTAKLGASAGDKEDVTNAKRCVYRWQPSSYTPQTVMNTVNPIGFNRPHKFLIGELQVLSEAYHAFYHNGTGNVAYIKPDGDNVEIPYFVVTNKDANGDTWTYTFTGVVPVDEAFEAEDGRDVILVYPFVAKKVVITPP